MTISTKKKDQHPFTYSRRIRWADSDAARIAYTGRFVDFSMEAMELWFGEVIGIDWYDSNTREGYGTPFVHVELDIHKSLRPGDNLDVTILLGKVGRSSIEIHPVGRKEDGETVFVGRFVCVVTDNATQRSMPIPASPLARLQAYRTVAAFDSTSLNRPSVEANERSKGETSAP